MPIYCTVEKEFLSVLEAETLSGISRWTWRVWAYKGKIASNKVGKRLLIPLPEVRRIIAEGSRPRLQGPQQ
jgi:hypothetical protein